MYMPLFENYFIFLTDILIFYQLMAYYSPIIEPFAPSTKA